MSSFALITEGETDQAVLDNILAGHYNFDIEVNIIQPRKDATDQYRYKNENFGGWEQVLEYCNSLSLSDVFLQNEWLVIQVDTDACNHPSFGVDLTKNGVAREVEDIIEDVRKKIISKIHSETFQNFSHRIFFAIAIHSTECWLLPLYIDNKKSASKILGCENHLKIALKKKNLEFAKEAKLYSKISKPYLKNINLLAGRKISKSLDIFLHSLPTIEG
ncbi:hypothetical protein [Janthinobacterium sp. LB3P112]|uniref:hypothetical protein n=1 Tax=Janthinobacterium sp. LB3P112 TaxID=3424196 RepID=UPI003F29A835